MEGIGGIEQPRQWAAPRTGIGPARRTWAHKSAAGARRLGRKGKTRRQCPTMAIDVAVRSMLTPKRPECVFRKALAKPLSMVTLSLSHSAMICLLHLLIHVRHG